MQTLLVTGLSGLIGTTIQNELSSRYAFQDLSYDTGIDIRDAKSVESVVQSSDARYVIHMAAKTDVDGCEKDLNNDMRILLKSDHPKYEIQTLAQFRDANFTIQNYSDWHIWKKVNSAFSINVFGTKTIFDACKKHHKKLIHVSTDFVFDGSTKDFYQEDDHPNPISWYGMTKWWSEQLALSYPDSCIVRFAYPYGALHPVRKDFVTVMRELFLADKPIRGIDDQIFTPTYAKDIPYALDTIIQNEARGTYHIVGSASLSPYEALVAISERFGYDKKRIERISYQEYYQDRAKRPKYMRISNEKIRGIGVAMKTFNEGLDSLDKNDPSVTR